MAFILRDASDQETARRETKERMTAIRDRMKADKAAGVRERGGRPIPSCSIRCIGGSGTGARFLHVRHPVHRHDPGDLRSFGRVAAFGRHLGGVRARRVHVALRATEAPGARGRGRRHRALRETRTGLDPGQNLVDGLGS